MWFSESPTIVVGGHFFSWAHTASKSSIIPWDCMTVGWRTVPHDFGRNIYSSVLATSRAIDNCSGVWPPGSFAKLRLIHLDHV